MNEPAEMISTVWKAARNGYQTGTRIILNQDGKTEVQILMRPDPAQRPTSPWWWRWVTLRARTSTGTNLYGAGRAPELHRP